jgi:hypothetical protein
VLAEKYNLLDPFPKKIKQIRSFLRAKHLQTASILRRLPISGYPPRAPKKAPGRLICRRLAKE